MDHMSATECPACRGKRLRPESLAVRVWGMSIADFTALPISRALEAAKKIKLTGREALIADCVAGAGRFSEGLGRHGDFARIR